MKLSPWFAIAAVSLGVAGRAPGQAERPKPAPKVSSKEAKEAEAAFNKEVAEAEAACKARVDKAREALVARLEAAKVEAAKAVNIDEAVALRDRIADLKAPKPAKPEAPEPKAAAPAPEAPKEESPERKAQRELAEAIQDVAWVGSPHGEVTFRSDGLIVASRSQLKPWRWVAVDKNTVLARFERGHLDVFFFDLGRGVVDSYTLGVPQRGQFAWSARRAGEQ